MSISVKKSITFDRKILSRWYIVIDSSEIENLVSDSILRLQQWTAPEVVDCTYFRRVQCLVYVFV